MKSINLKLKTIKQGNETKYLLKGFGDYILYQIFRLTDRPVLPKSALLEYYDAVKKMEVDYYHNISKTNNQV